jgi:F-type H+-transporting ATPase subunit alpha
LDPATQKQLDRGQRLVEVLKQGQYVPMSLDQEVTMLYAVSSGHLDDVPLDKIASFESAFHKFLETNHPDIAKDINATSDLTSETEQKLKIAISEFKQSGAY